MKLKHIIANISILVAANGCTSSKKEIKDLHRWGSLFFSELSSIQTSEGRTAVPVYNAVGLLPAGAGPGAGSYQKPCASRPGKTHPEQGTGVCSGNNYIDVEIPTTGLSLSYNSQAHKLQRGFGYGFSLSIDEQFFSNAALNQYTLLQGDGSIISHHKSKEGEWVSDDIRLVRSVFQANGTGLIQLLPEGEKAEFSLLSSSNGINHYVVSRYLDRNGNPTQIVRNAEGLITQIIDPYGSKVEVSYLNGLASSLKDAAGNSYAFSYDASHRLISFSQPDGRAWTFSYLNNLSWIVENKSANGKRLKYTYYTSGDLESIKNDLGYVTLIQYEPNEVKVKTSLYTEIEKFDSQGRLLSYSKNGVGTVYTRDANGLVISEKDPIGRVTTFSYTKTGNFWDPRPSKIIYPDNGGTTTFVQVGGLRPSPPSQITHVEGATKSVTYFDVIHEGVLSEVNGLNGQDVTNLTYDAKGNLLTVKKNGVLVESYAYDLKGRVVSVTDDKGLTTSYTYSTNGDLSSETDHFGRVTSYQYDLLGNVVQVVTPTRRFIQEYDSVGETIVSSERSDSGGREEISVTTHRNYFESGALSVLQVVQKVSGQLQMLYEEIYKSVAGQIESRTLKNASGETYNLDQ